MSRRAWLTRGNLIRHIVGHLQHISQMDGLDPAGSSTLCLYSYASRSRALYVYRTEKCMRRRTQRRRFSFSFLRLPYILVYTVPGRSVRAVPAVETAGDVSRSCAPQRRQASKQPFTLDQNQFNTGTLILYCNLLYPQSKTRNIGMMFLSGPTTPAVRMSQYNVVGHGRLQPR